MSLYIKDSTQDSKKRPAAGLYDGAGKGGNALDVSYDNSTTELEATNVQDAIDEVFTSVSNGKTLIADAITDKGVETSATDTFAIMAQHIAEIEGGGSGIDISLNANWYTNLSDCVDSNFQKFRLSSETVHLVEYDSNTRELVILEDSIAMFSFENDHASNNIAEMNIYINGISTEMFNIPLNSYVFRLYRFSAGDRIKVYKGSGGWSCIASCFIKKPSGSGGNDGNATYYDITYKENVYLSERDGSEISETGDHATDFLDIGNYNHILAYHVDSWQNKFYNAFYDEDKAFITNFNVNNWSYVEIPENAKYCRLSTTSSSICKVVAFKE